MAQSFKVPQAVSNNAKRGLELRKKHGRGGLTTAQAGAQGIGSGVARARDLIGGSVSLETVKRMSAFFDRHRKNKDTPPSEGNGMISWLLWGGDAGDRWAKGIIKREAMKDFETLKAIWAEKHGRHNQKRHGYRYGGNLTLDRARAMRRDGNWADYRKRADAKGGAGDGKKYGKYYKDRAVGKKNYNIMKDGKTRQLTSWDNELKVNAAIVRDLGVQGIAVSPVGREPVRSKARLMSTNDIVEYLSGFRPISSTKELTTKPQGGSHGASIKNPRVYEALRRNGYSKEAAARISNAMVSKKATLTKTVAGRKLPASAFLVVGDPEQVGTWRLPVRNADGSPDPVRMGAAWAALHGGYRGNKYEGEGEAQAIAKLRKMYAEQGRKPPSEAHEKAGEVSKELHGRVWVFTDKSGRYRWVSISSNSYQDREGEIVSQKALETAVERGDMGELRWWHEGGAVIGDTDFQMMQGRMLIESGTFKSEKIGAAFADKKGLGVSVGFLHPPNQPMNGIYDDIRIVERSVLPAKRAANGLTSFGVA